MPVSAPPPSWANLRNKPNTVSGFGITDMASQSVASAVNATNANNVPFSGVTSKPTTLTGYGITDEKCKAWVNFNGTGTVAIRASFNVSSLTDNGVGDYTVNFTNAMQDTNYCVSGNSNNSTGSTASNAARSLAGIVYSTGSVRVINQIGSGSAADQDLCNVSIFR